MAFSLPRVRSAFLMTAGPRYSGTRSVRCFACQVPLSGSPCRRPWPLPRCRTATSRLSPPSPACRSFAFDINVGYPELGEVTLRGVAGEAGQSERLSSARPYSRNRGIEAFAALARMWGWPHGVITVSLTADTDEAKTALLEELCWHRLLDMLGAFMAVSPQGGRIAGSIVTRRVGHAADVELMRLIRKTSWVKV